jgi:hypothetical protein
VDTRFNPGSTLGLRSASAPLPSVDAMNIAQALLIAVLVVLVIGRRFAGQPLRAQSLLIPVGLTVWAGYQLRGAHLTVNDIGFLLISVVLGLASGAARGITVHLYPRDGHLWMRYRWLTAVVWLASIALRVGLVVGAHLAGVGLSSGSTIMLTLGVSLIAEVAVVGARAARTGIPFAPRQRAVVGR